MAAHPPKKQLSSQELLAAMAKGNAYPQQKSVLRVAGEALHESAQITAERFRRFPLESIVYNVARLIPIPVVNDPIVWRNIIRKTMNRDFDLVLTPQNRQTAEEFIENLKTNPRFKEEVTARVIQFQPKKDPGERQPIRPDAGTVTNLEDRKRRATGLRVKASWKLADLKRMHDTVRHTANPDNVVFHPAARRFNEAAERVKLARRRLARTG